MNEDIEDPNNHVPKISPDDLWDDLDSDVESAPQVSQRGGSAIPTRKKQDKREPSNSSSSSLESEDHVASLANQVPRDLTDRKVATVRPETKKRFQKQVASNVRTFDVNKGSLEQPSPTNQFDAGSGGIPDDLVGTVAQSSSEKAIPSEAESQPTRRKQRVSRGRDQWGEERKQGSFGWMFYSGLVVISLTVLAVFLNQTSEQRNTRASEKSFFSSIEPAKEKLAVEAGANDQLAPIEFLSSNKQLAVEMYTAFVKADSVENILPLIFQPDENESLIRGSWELSASNDDWFPKGETNWTLLEEESGPYAILSGSDQQYANFTAFFRLENEELKLDWRATTSYGTASFETLRAGEGEAGEIRGLIDRSDFYTLGFPEKTYRSFKLVSPDEQSTLWVYTVVDSKIDEQVSKLFERSQITGIFQSDAFVTMSLSRGPEGSLPNQWLITGLLRSNWLDESKQ